MVRYRIKDWDEHFENSESRKVKFARWVAIPNKHDGKGYRRLARHERAVELFCAWNLIVQVASKMPVRGVFEDSDGPLAPVDLSDATGFKTELFELAFNILSQQYIGWIIVEEVGTNPGVIRMTSRRAGVEGREGREGIEGRKEHTPLPPEGDGGLVSENSSASSVSAVKPCEPRVEASIDCNVPGGYENSPHTTQPPCDSPPVSEQKRSKSKTRKKPGVPSEARKDAGEEMPKGFVNFWQTWPIHFRKKGRLKCLKIWQSKNLEPLADAIVGSVKSHINCDQWKKDKGQFIPLPASWLNDDAWETPLVGGDSDASDFYSPGFVPAPATPEIIRIALGINGSEA